MATKHQHYVPQFYLRQFADDREQIWAYDKVEDRSFRTGVRNVAGERYFYDSDVLEKEVGDRQAMEKFLGELEGNYKTCIERLLLRLRSGGYARLHPETRATIANFAVIQLLRTPEQRIARAQTWENLIRFLRKHPSADAHADVAAATLTKDAIREGQVATLRDGPSVAHMSAILNSHIWVFAHRRPEHGFYTSDVPITKTGRIPRPGRGNSGIASPGVEIHVPLSHDYFLTLYERSAFRNSQHLDGAVIELLNPEHVVYSRKWAVMHSTRYVFSLEDDFELARTICKEEPEWRDIHRRRVVSNHDEPVTRSAEQQTG